MNLSFASKMRFDIYVQNNDNPKTNHVGVKWSKHLFSNHHNASLKKPDFGTINIYFTK